MKKNKGMFLEALINRSNEYIWKNKIGFIEKRFTKVHISKIDGNKVVGFLASKNLVDYSGFINSTPFEFEAKTTILNKLYFKNIKVSQLDFLESVANLKAQAFFIIYFQTQNIIVKVPSTIITALINEGCSSISLEEAIKKGKELKVLYPGIVNFWS